MIAVISNIGGKIGRPAPGSLPLLAITILCLVIAVAICADTFWLIVQYFQPLFYMDQWATVDSYRVLKSGDYSLSDLFSQHNEHRIAFPRLIFLADFVFGRGLNIINISTVFLIQLLHAILLARIERQLNKGLISIICIAIVFILLFSFGQAENFIWGFQVQFVGVYAAGSLALWWFAQAVERQKKGSPFLGFALGAAAMAIVATYTMSNGVICCAVMIFLGLALRARAALAASIAILAASLLFAYFWHFQIVAGHSPPGFVFQHPGKVIEYIIVYLGGPAGRVGSTAAELLGAIGLLLTSFAAIRVILYKEQNAARAAMVGVMIFIALTAGATAFGRAFFGLEQALAS